MPPRAKAAVPKPSIQREAFPHTDDCHGHRMERYTATRPDGSEVAITRCMECAAQTTK